MADMSDVSERCTRSDGAMSEQAAANYAATLARLTVVEEQLNRISEMLQQKMPAWTEMNNVSPGVALLEKALVLVDWQKLNGLSQKMDDMEYSLTTCVNQLNSQLVDIDARLKMSQPSIPVPVQPPPGFNQSATAGQCVASGTEHMWQESPITPCALFDIFSDAGEDYETHEMTKIKETVKKKKTKTREAGFEAEPELF